MSQRWLHCGLVLLTMLRPATSLVALVGRHAIPTLRRRGGGAAARRLSILPPQCSMQQPPRSSRPFASAVAPAAAASKQQQQQQQRVTHDGAAAMPAPLQRQQPSEQPPAAIPSASSNQALPDLAPIFEVGDVQTMREVTAILLALPETTFHACDTEVADLDIKKTPLGQGRVTCVSIYSGPDVDYGRGPGHALWVDTTDPEVLAALKPFLECERCLKVWHNYGFDRHVLWNHGVDVRGFGGDTMHMARLWDAGRLAGYSLEALTTELVGRRKTPMLEIFGIPILKADGTPGARKQLPPIDDLQNNPMTRPEWVQYSCYDSQGTWLLHEVRGASAGFCWLLLASAGSCWLLLAPAGSCWLLKAPAGSCWLLKAPEGS